MEILEKLLESGATVDFQDRVSERAGIGWEAGGGSRLPLCMPTWDTDRLPQGPGPISSGCMTLGRPHLLSVSLAWTTWTPRTPMFCLITAQALECPISSQYLSPGYLPALLAEVLSPRALSSLKFCN